MKRKLTCILISALILTGCAENPDSEIIAHKDMDNLISEAQQTDESKADVAELRQYDSYTADLENDSLRVKIHADARVDIPQTDKLSIFRVKQHDFTQEECDRFRKALMGDVPVYEGESLTLETKEMIEKEIGDLRADIQRIQAEEPDIADGYVQEYQAAIDRMQTQYDTAPDQIDPTAYPSEGRLESVAERLAAEPESGWWQWENDLNPDGAVCYVCNADGTAAFYVQNNKNYSNNLIYSASPVGAERMTVLGGGTDLVEEQADMPGMPEHFLACGLALDTVDASGTPVSYTFQPIPGDSAALSQADAQKQAEDFLHSMGEDGFAFYDGGKYAKRLDLQFDPTDDPNACYYRTCWILRYYRSFDGVLLEQNSGMKYAEGWEGESYRKQLWPGEFIDFQISDAGIVGFSWNAPLDITETVVEDAALKPFSEISSTFERMLPMVAAPPEEYETGAEITIDRVALSYSRISEKDSFDTGLVVPVWGFIGECRGGKMSFTGVQLAVNAIDGSVIDANLGY